MGPCEYQCDTMHKFLKSNTSYTTDSNLCRSAPDTDDLRRRTAELQTMLQVNEVEKNRLSELVEVLQQRYLLPHVRLFASSDKKLHSFQIGFQQQRNVRKGTGDPERTPSTEKKECSLGEASRKRTDI